MEHPHEDADAQRHWNARRTVWCDLNGCDPAYLQVTQPLRQEGDRADYPAAAQLTFGDESRVFLPEQARKPCW